MQYFYKNLFPMSNQREIPLPKVWFSLFISMYFAIGMAVAKDFSDQWVTDGEDEQYVGRSAGPSPSKNWSMRGLQAESDHNLPLAKEIYTEALASKELSKKQEVFVLERLCELCRQLGLDFDRKVFEHRLMATAHFSGLSNGVKSIETSQDAEVRILIADTLVVEGRYEEAEEMFKSSFHCSSDEGLDFYLRTMAAERLTRLYLLQSSVSEAESVINPLYKHVLRVHEASPCELTIRALLCALSAKTELAISQGELDLAMKYSDRSKEVLSKSASASSFRRLIVFADRARIFELKKDDQAAINYFNSALSAANKGQPLSHIYQDPVKIELATLYKKVGNAKKALAILQTVDEP